jgi:hypothetical protein
VTAMNYLVSLAMLLLMLVPRNQDLPEEFYQIPERDRAGATVVVAGTFAQGRSPCIFMPDGSRRWALESWFRVSKVYRGKVGGRAIYINSGRSPKAKDVNEKLEAGREYLVLLRPGGESMKLIKAGGHVPFWDALRDEEIITIVELK